METGGRRVLRIRELRRELEIGQRETARRAGIDPARLCEIETGRHSPTVRTLAKIAGGLGVEVVDLFARTEEPAMTA